MRIFSWLQRLLWRLDEALSSESPLALSAEVD